MRFVSITGTAAPMVYFSSKALEKKTGPVLPEQTSCDCLQGGAAKGSAESRCSACELHDLVLKP